MLAWVPLSNNPSCIHKHAIGCLHLSSPACCACLEIDLNTSSGRILSLANARHASRHIAALSRYCRKCQEYWSAHPLSGNHLHRLASFHTLSGHPSELFLESANTPGLGSNLLPALPYSTPGQPTRSLHHRKSRRDNIDNLREELHAIHQGITKILNNLQLLSEALLTCQPAAQYTSNTRHLIVPSTTMNVQLPRPAIGEPGSMAPVLPNLPDHGSHGPIERQNIPQGSPTGATSGSSHPHLNSQNSNSNIYTPSTFSGDFTFTAANNGQVNFQPSMQLPLDTTAAQPTQTEFPATSQNTAPYDPRQHGNAMRYWNMQRTSYPQMWPTPVQSSGSISINGQPVLVQQTPNPLPMGLQHAAAPMYRTMPHDAATNNVQAAQNGSGVGGRPIYPQPFYVQPNPYMPYPQIGGSPGYTQYRRHTRTQSSTANNSSTNANPASPRQNVRAGGQVGRRRMRPADDTNPQLARRMSSSQVPRVPNTAASMSSESSMMEIPRYITYLTPEQRLHIQRLADLEALTNSMRSGHPVSGSHFRQSLDDDIPETPKGLDDGKDGRPAPKEDDELTINLECKICMSQLVDTVMLPCGHAILCRWCAEQHMPSSRVDRARIKGQPICPMCRAVVKSKIRIYLS